MSYRMAGSRDSDDERIRGTLPRVLDVLGQGLMLTGGAVIVAALLGVAGSAAGIGGGVIAVTAGLFCRSAASLTAATSLQTYQPLLEPRPEASITLSPGTARLLTTIHTETPEEEEARFIRMFKEEEPELRDGRFATIIEEQRRQGRNGRGV